MRRLLLLRHAKAVPQGRMADEERPLADRGRREVPLVAQFAASRGIKPDLALISPSLRTRETWALFVPALNPPPLHRFEPRLYSAPAERILDLARAAPETVQTLLLVGHNPGFEDVAQILIGAGETDALIRFGGSMPTSSLALIELPSRWATIEPRTGRLAIFVTPKSLGADAN
jgi:phosphohistidine phosphatase